MSAIGLSRHCHGRAPSLRFDCRSKDVDTRHKAGHAGRGIGAFLYDLKKLFAASLEARFLVMAVCNRSISEVISAIRSASSSTESSERSCPISWVTFFLGLSSSSMAIVLLRARQTVKRLPAGTPLANQMVF